MPSPNWLPCAIADPAAPPTTAPPTHAGNLTELQPGILRLRRVGRAVPQQHVRQLVRHHADDFAFRRRRVEHAAVDEHRAARQRERVDLFQVHRRERILVDRLLELRRRRRDESIAELGRDSGRSARPR